MSMMIHRAVQRMRAKALEEQLKEEQKAPVEEQAVEKKPSAPKRGGRKPKR